MTLTQQQLAIVATVFIASATAAFLTALWFAFQNGRLAQQRDEARRIARKLHRQIPKRGAGGRFTKRSKP